MSVLIRGMQMPGSCLECMNSGFRTAVKCAEWTEISAGRRENERAWSCPLVELPEKHGDLIDRDALPRDVMDFDVWNASVVIEAEGEASGNMTDIQRLKGEAVDMRDMSRIIFTNALSADGRSGLRGRKSHHGIVLTVKMT